MLYYYLSQRALVLCKHFFSASTEKERRDLALAGKERKRKQERRWARIDRERNANENYAGGQFFLLIRVRGPRHLMSNAEVPHDSEIGPLADGHVGDLRKMLFLCCRELFRSEQENERLNARLQRAIAHVQVVDLKYARLLEILLEILTDVAFSSLRVRSIMQEHNQLHQASSKLTDL